MAIKIQGTEVVSDNRELTNIKFGTDNITFPTADGSNGQILATDGNGQLTFVNDTNTNDIDYINAASFDTANGVLTLSGVGNAGATVDLDGRYLTDITNESIGDLSNVDLTGLVNNAVLKYDSTASEWIVSTNNDIANATANAIIPVAFAFVDTTSNGSGTSISWSNWNSSNATLDFTFSTAQPDANYAVITDSDTYDDFFVGITNKTTTGFRAEFYDNSGSRTPSSFSPFSFVVYASDPVTTIKSTVGGINELSDVTITSATNGQVLKYNGTNWVNDTDAGGINNVVEDTSPELGGNLDAGNYDILNVSQIFAGVNRSLFIRAGESPTPNSNGQTLRLRGGTGQGAGNVGGYVIVEGGSPTNGATLYGDVVIAPNGGQTWIHNLRYPTVDGTPGQVLTTDGSGLLTFNTVTATVDWTQIDLSGLGTSIYGNDAATVNSYDYIIHNNSSGSTTKLDPLDAIAGLIHVKEASDATQNDAYNVLLMQTEAGATATGGSIIGRAAMVDSGGLTFNPNTNVVQTSGSFLATQNLAGSTITSNSTDADLRIATNGAGQVRVLKDISSLMPVIQLGVGNGGAWFQANNDMGIVSHYATTANTAATAMSASTEYMILSLGTSDFTAVGAADNDAGTIFTATGSTTGDGEVVATSGLKKAFYGMDYSDAEFKYYSDATVSFTSNDLTDRTVSGTLGYMRAAGYKTDGTTGFLKSDGTVDTSTYLTGYAESDTLASVTGRGNTTTNSIKIGDLNFGASANTVMDAGGRYWFQGFNSAGNVDGIAEFILGNSSYDFDNNATPTQIFRQYGYTGNAGTSGFGLQFTNVDIGHIKFEAKQQDTATGADSTASDVLMAEILSTYDNTTTANVQEGKIFLKNYKSTGTAGGIVLDNTLSLTDDGVTVSGQADNVFNVGYTQASSNTSTGAMTVNGGVGILGDIRSAGHGELNTLSVGTSTISTAGGGGSAAHIAGGDLRIDTTKSLRWDGSFPSYIQGASGTSGYVKINAGNSATGLSVFPNSGNGSTTATVSKIRLGPEIPGSNTENTSVIEGLQTIWIDPAPTAGDANGTVVIKGDLQVDGTTTTLNSTTLTIDDLNIVVASGAADSAAADGAGLTVDGASKSITWNHANQYFTANSKLEADGFVVSGSSGFLKADGTVDTNTYLTTYTDTNTTYDLLPVANTTNGIIRLDPSSGTNDDVAIFGLNDTTVTSNSTGIYISTTDTNTDTNTTYAISAVDSGNDAIIRLTAGGSGSGTDDVKLVAGSNITLTPSGDNITIASTDTNTDTNYYLTGLGFNANTGVLTATVSGATNPTVDLDGRYTDAAGAFNIVPTYSGSSLDSITYNDANKAVELRDPTGDTSVGYAFSPFRVNQATGETFKLSMTFKGSAADTDGIYFRVYEYNAELPAGKTHISNSAQIAQVQEDTSGKTDWYENSGITTDWQTTTYTYTPTAGAVWANIVVLNWTGYVGSIYVKPQVVTRIAQDDTNTTYTLTAATTGGTNADPNLSLNAGGSGSGTDTVQLVGAGATTVTRNSDGQITISSTDTNTNTDTLQDIAADSTNATRYISFVNNTSGAQSAGVDTALTFNPSTNNLDLNGTMTVDCGDNATGLSVRGNSGGANSGRLNLGFGNGTNNPKIQWDDVNNDMFWGMGAHDSPNNMYLWGNAAASLPSFTNHAGGVTSNIQFEFTTGGDLNVYGTISAASKSFVINHPTKEGMKLRHGSLEGPENGVYIRGRLKDDNTIELPDYWVGLVYEDTITVNLTPIGKHQKLYVQDIGDNKVIIGNDNFMSNSINCFYTVFAERKDIDPLITEYEA